MIQQAIAALTQGVNLDKQTTRDSFTEIMNGTATQAQTASFLTGLTIKGETIEEITACAEIMREKCTKLTPAKPVLEIVGTGGDRAATFNISTASAIVTAAAGVPTAKHGNRSVSSRCGAADCLEALGLRIDLDAEANAQMLGRCGFCFMFAPVYHASMKYAAPVRRELAIPTIFNILGPLANPAGAGMQLLGVYDEQLLEPLAGVLVNLGVANGCVVHGMDGLDEITLTGPTKAVFIRNGALVQDTLHPEELGLKLCHPEDLTGGDAEENAAIVREIFAGSKGPKRDIVLLNTAVGLVIAGQAASIKEGITAAMSIIDSGAAMAKLEEVVACSQQIGGIGQAAS